MSNGNEHFADSNTAELYKRRLNIIKTNSKVDDDAISSHSAVKYNKSCTDFFVERKFTERKFVQKITYCSQFTENEPNYFASRKLFLNYS